MHPYDAPSPDVDPDENLRLHAEAVSRLYLQTEGLAARTDLTITEIRSTAMLLTFAGLLEETPPESRQLPHPRPPINCAMPEPIPVTFRHEHTWRTELSFKQICNVPYRADGA